jgi:catechol 2,3-dioxygenase-like lactoylglutathione lyase family enzyme
MNGSGLLGWPTWIGVVVDDLETHRRFWSDVLGVEEHHSGEDFVSFRMEDGRWFELIERSDDPQYDRRRFQVGFQVSDIVRTYAELVARGVAPVTQIFEDEEPWAYFRDPEGNVFAIKQLAGRTAAASS